MKTFSQFMEAAGDPIKPAQVIPMDAETQRNLQKAMMRPTSAVKPAPKPDKIKNFVRRSMNNTLLTPLQNYENFFTVYARKWWISISTL